MVANLETMSLNATQQADVMKLFNSIQQVHDNMSMASGQIATLGKTLQPNQFTFIMQHAIHPLFQIKLPTHLCSPADVKFEKEHLMAEESLEEECSNKVLPWIFLPYTQRSYIWLCQDGSMTRERKSPNVNQWNLWQHKRNRKKQP